MKEAVLRNFRKFTGKHLSQSPFLIKLQAACNIIKKGALAQVFSCEFSEISKNNFLTEHLWPNASACNMFSKDFSVVVEKL